MWEIYAYHNSASLFGIFNAIAAVMASAGYMGVLAVILFVGFIAALFSYALAPQKLQGWQWLGSVVIVYCVLFLPRVTVQIIDKTGAGPVQVVDNVPLGIASLGSLTSTVGNAVTEFFETAFQIIPGPAALPAELSYQQTGLMFGSRIIQQTRSVSFPETGFKADLMSFLTNCTAYDVADGSISANALAQTDDIWSLIANTNPARFTRVTTSGGLTAATCVDAYNILSTRVPANVNALRMTLARALNPTLSPATAGVRVDNQIYTAYARAQIATASSTASTLILQNAMINAVRDAAEMSCQQINDPTCMLGATARANAVAQQNSAWINGAKIAADALPVIRNVAEALIYAIFPIIILLLFLSTGKHTVTMFLAYVSVLISIQLWPPLYAILNYMATSFSEMQTASAADLGTGVSTLSATTAGPIYSNAISGQAVVSYLIMAIPYLAWSLANKLSNFGSTLIGGVSAMQSTAASASAAAASGNVSMGNVTMDQRMVSPSTSNPFVSKAQNAQAAWITSDGVGRKAVSLLKNEGITSTIIQTQATQSDVEQANQTASAAASDMLSAGSAQSSALTQAFNKVRTSTTSSSSAAGQSRAAGEDLSRAAESLSSEVKRITKGTGYSEDQVAGVLLKFGAMPGAGGVGGGAAVEKRYGVKLSDDEKAILDRANSDSFKTARAFSDRVSRDTTFMNRLSQDGSSGSSLASALTQTAQRSQTAERKYAEASSWAQQVQSALVNGTTISRDISKDPAFFEMVMANEAEAANYRDNPQALQAFWASKIGSLATTPTTFRDGSPTLGSAGAARERFESSRSDSAVNPNIGGIGAGNDSSVRNGALPSPGRAPSVGSPGSASMPSAPLGGGANDPLANPAEFRSSVSADGSRATATASQDIGTFNERHKLTRTEGGTLKTSDSMAARSAQMLGDDVIENEGERNARLEEARVRAANSPLQQDRNATSEIPTMMPSSGQRKPRK
ncbi:conjugal transfer protein TraG N-terminal domain-containing protein [Piscinibacter gummiphilus]|uniref:Conjugal transfer protein TraG N-terminal domain-containing protein n=1 Tax=Piscinibacter gummiphilus TaxID=946333 RepID=A0ABZ0D1R6_9BURK|nr:conjugal transfer protein TraG N-terminal domain-containing protein [Piscinibacter gummiphilus]WOB11123.1 conjugal transfer protein TraG N-terminal domain-containing protein [Piscinibacter gummiphilus]